MPLEIIFTNHDWQTSIMPFANNGYYNYERLVYKANQTVPAGINRTVNSQIEHDSCWYSITGRRYASRPSKKGIYIYQGKIRTLGTN